MPELMFTKDINAPAEAVFDLIADLPNYGKWLASSNLYRAVMQYSELPIQAGTTYVDQGLMGTVTTFERPKAITFHQVTKTRLGGLDIEIRYTLNGHGDHTHLKREVSIKAAGLFWLLQLYLVRSIRTEVERILEKMKVYLEANHTG